MWSEDLQHAARAGPDVEEIGGPPRGDDIAERRFDLALVDVERADLVPLGGIFAKIGGGELGALALDRAEPL